MKGSQKIKHTDPDQNRFLNTKLEFFIDQKSD